MLSFDLNQAQRFIELLHGNSNQPVCWQVFHDSKSTVDALKQPTTFHAKVDDCVEYINQIQAHNYGVYITLNKTDGKGREEHNIVGYRTIFADIDNMALPKLPIQPHLVTQRDELHSHCYWFVKGIVTDDQFKKYQKQVAMFLGSDEQVCDPSRVVRVAGTYNMKNPANPAMYNIVKDFTQLVGRDHTYSLDEIDNAFKLTGEKLAKLEQWSGSRNSLDTGEGFNDNPVYRDQLIKFLGRCEPAVEGSGTMTLIKVASFGYDKGIPLSECQEIMWEHYNPRCEPIWEEPEHRHFNSVVERAYKYANNAVGCRTCTAEFETLAPAVIEPPCGWAENAKLATKKREQAPAIPMILEPLPTVDTQDSNITTVDDTERDNARLAQLGGLIAQADDKSAPLDLARIFLLSEFPHGNLIRNQKVFYEFNGKYWEQISDDGIKSLVMHFFARVPKWKLAPSKINNIYITIEQLVHKEHLDFNTWMDGEKHSGATNIMNNCIVELVGGEVVERPHTNQYFSLIGLNYDYIKNCGEPEEFIKFLNDIWSDDPLLKLALQEFMGLLLTSDNDYHKMALFVGKSRGGKGVITNAITQMIGVKNTVAPALETLTDNSVKEAMIKSKLITIPEATQVSQAKQFATLGMLKAASSGDLIQYHQLFKGGASGYITAKMILIANTMPKFIDESGALANRFIAFPFIKSFIGREDLDLPNRIGKEQPQIFNFAMEGLKRLIRNGKFTQATSSVEMVEDMKRDMFPLSDFCDECCVMENGAEITSNALYAVYQYHCAQRDVKHTSHNNFTKYLKSSYLPVTHGRMLHNGKQVRGFKGMTINSEYQKCMLTSTNGSGDVVSIGGTNHLIRDKAQ